MTLLATHSRIRTIEQSTHLSVCSDTKKANLTGIEADLSVMSCFQMRRGVMTEYNHPRSIRGRRRNRLVDVEDARRNLRVFNEADDPHNTLTFGTGQRINLIYLLNQSCPVLPEGL